MGLLPKKKAARSLGHYDGGTNTAWYSAQKLTDTERHKFRQIALAAQEAKTLGMAGEGPAPLHSVNTPTLKPESLMPRRKRMGLRALSLFSGGGGLDLGFDLAGMTHVASYEIMTDAGKTLKNNRPRWNVHHSEEGNVRSVRWKPLAGKIDVIHGGPPCQPFSMAGRQRGEQDSRNLFPEFIRAVREIRPRAFLAENVASLGQAKFADFVRDIILSPVAHHYHVESFTLNASAFGVPQTRTRLFFVGIRRNTAKREFRRPDATHDDANVKNPPSGNGDQQELFDTKGTDLEPCIGARKALGLPDIGYDGLAPTIRSGLTGPRHTTSILSSVSALAKWNHLQIWPNGVAPNRQKASVFPAKNGHFRLSVQDCALLQGFPEDWVFHGAVYMVIGQIGNSVAPPVAYALAQAIGTVLK